MEIVAEFLGIDADKDIWKYFHCHWLALFPKLKCRSNFVRHAVNLWQYKELRYSALSRTVGGFY